MRTTQRVSRAALAAAAAIVIGGSGVAVGAAVAEPTAVGVTAASLGPPVLSSSAGTTSYAGVVRQVLPSVVLIRTPDGLGSGVVLDRSGNIVTNAHVTGSAQEFGVQVAGDTAPRTARLVGTYPPDDLAVIRADDPSGLKRPRSVTRIGRRPETWCWLSATRSACPAASPRESSPRLTARSPAGRAGLGRGHATRRDPDQRTYQPGKQRRGAGQHLRTGDRHPDAGRGQPAGRRSGTGHRFRHPVQPGPRHRHADHRHRPCHQLAPRGPGRGGRDRPWRGRRTRPPRRGWASHGHQRRSGQKAACGPATSSSRPGRSARRTRRRCRRP